MQAISQIDRTPKSIEVLSRDDTELVVFFLTVGNLLGLERDICDVSTLQIFCYDRLPLPALSLSKSSITNASYHSLNLE